MVLFVSSELKRQFMELLEKDVEFRYAVAGYLGLSEIIKRLDEHDRKFNEILAEIKALREDQKRLWENQNKLWENQNRLWEEIKAVIEGQSKLWEEIKNLREGQSKLWEEVKSLREGQNKLWEETKALREGQSRLWEEVKSLREGQNKLWGEVRGLREVYVRLEGRVTGLEKAVSTLARTIGVTLNDFVASFVEEMLRLSGIPEEKINVSANVRIAYGETIREVDIFNSDPIVVGQVTTYISSIEEAKNELNKLLEDVRFVEKIAGRKVFMAILAS
jgi:predicted nuclease with TOPRIM domain